MVKMRIERNMPTYRNGERGVASILTVIFFILIASVITIGFMRLSLNEGTQSLEDSLSKSALASAYSGVNDAKRAILYCLQYKNDPTGHPECDKNDPNSINNPNCRGFFENVTLRQNIGMPDPDPTDGSIHVGDDPTDTINERYTCVTISNDTYDVSGPLIIDQSDSNTTLIPLRSTSGFNSVRITWHKRPAIAVGLSLANLNYGGPGNETQANYRDSDAYGNYFEWDTNWPALLKMSLYTHPNAGITYNADGTTDIAEKTAYLYPRNNATPTSSSVDVNGLIPRQLTNCNAGGFTVEGTQYLCQITLTGFNALNPSFDPTSRVMYLQLSNTYVDTDFSVELLNGSTPVKFDDVSPVIDSTGAVGDTYRRVKVRLRYQGSTPLLHNALDTGSGICKNFIVGSDAAIFRETCGY